MSNHAEAHLSALIESTKDHIWSVDLNYRLILFNQALQKRIRDLYGIELAEGMSFHELFPPEKAALWASFYARVLSEGYFRVEYFLPTHRVMELSFNLIKVEGEVTGISIFGKDVTHEKQLAATTQALQQSEERYRAVFQASLDVININRLSDEKYIDVNKAFLNELGFERGEVIGRTPQEIGLWVDACDRDRLLEILRTESTPRGLEMRFRKKNGKIIWGEISVSRIEINGVPCILSFTRDITQAKAAENKIRNLAFYDPLTGLPNRRLLFEKLQPILPFGSHSKNLQALLLVDLDNFKVLNDTLGYQGGGLLLQEVAQRISSCTSGNDTVARVGSSQFVVLLEGLNNASEKATAQAMATGKKILALVSRPYMIEEHECLSTASIGIKIFSSQRNITEDILLQTDIALSQAQAAGGNTMRIFSPALQTLVNSRATLEADLRQALRGKEFLLYYQPQVEQGRLTGAEALIRWDHPRRGVMSPAEFIPLAEESRLILPLGKWVLETACAQIRLWAKHNLTNHLSISVNISALQFRQPEFIDQVLAAIDRTGANPRNLRLELTESMLVENIEEVIVKMTELKSHGLSFALDDFGTGYSSLTYLKRLPLDQLKIDRAFVHDILVDSTSGAIAQTVISLGRAMNLSVLAEGVETDEQIRFLSDLGCHAFQGYLFSHPLPLEEFMAFFHQFQADTNFSACCSPSNA
jgi:diguanylate cyclase (GGDEF)-like protein/PAS domain S-box-containing protein